MSKVTLEQRRQVIRGGANWLIIFGVLSILNSIFYAYGNGFNFIFGLTSTKIIDTTIIQTDTTSKLIGIAINLVLAGVIFLIGMRARKEIKAMFIFGFILLSLDGIVGLFLGDYMGFCGHVFALIFIGMAISNFKHVKELEKIEEFGQDWLHDLD